MTRSGQGGFCPDPIHSSLLFCHFPGSFRFRSIAFSAFVLLKTCLRNQEPSVEQLTDSIGEVDMGFAFKQVVNGVRSRQGGRNLVGRRKCGTDIAASVPGHLGMIFEVPKELFFHLATKRLPCRTQGSRFPARNPPRDALTGDLEKINATHAKLMVNALRSEQVWPSNVRNCCRLPESLAATYRKFGHIGNWPVEPYE